MAVPTVTGVNHNSGPTGGGTAVTITGTNFVNVSSVSFGGQSASFSVTNSTTIQASSPPHAAGSVDIRVITNGGTSDPNPNDTFFYQVNIPTVTNVNPNHGPTGGGTAVTITGTNFSNAISVSFGGTAASFSITNATTITASSPPHAAGVVDITVTNPDGTSTIVTADQFTYQ
jgi:hypothetical protein